VKIQCSASTQLGRGPTTTDYHPREGFSQSPSTRVGDGRCPAASAEHAASEAASELTESWSGVFTTHPWALPPFTPYYVRLHQLQRVM
jgi:hypothetical protein